MKEKKKEIQTLETLHSLTVLLEFSSIPQNFCSIKHYLSLSLAHHALQTDHVSPAGDSFFTLLILQQNRHDK